MDGYVNRQSLQDIANAIREKNGSSDTYKPGEMASAIGDLAVEEFDWGKYGYIEQDSNYLNALLKEGIASAMEKFEANVNVANWSSLFQYNKFIYKIPYLPSSVTNLTYTFNESAISDISNIDFSKVKTVFYTFTHAYISKIPEVINLANATGSSLFSGAFLVAPLDFVFYIGDSGSVFDLQQWFRSVTFNTQCSVKLQGKRSTKNAVTFFQQVKFNVPLEFFEYLDCENQTTIAFNGIASKKIKLGSVVKCTSFTIDPTNACEVFEFNEWKQGDLSLVNCSALSMLSIKYDIFHAINSADGATNRILTLHATPLATWNNEISNTTPTADDAELLGVEDWDRYKKEDGTLYTWCEITSLIKDITIA